MTVIPFENSFARLPERFYARLSPEPVSAPNLIKVNHTQALRLGLDPIALERPGMVAALAGNVLPEGAEPLAQAYAGHQFGNWNPQLGDGRAILLGEMVAPDGYRFDIQLKGSGRTPFSRRGDGRAPLGPVLREYIISEAMAALGVPTTRSLALVAMGDSVYRDEIEPGAVLTRVAASHIRVGTFQFFAARGDSDAVRLLTDHAIERHYPDAAEAEDPALAFLQGVVGRQATLVARWMALGFIHGVMNTDNMTVSGETIDYGPCAFMDSYHPLRVFSSIDHGGRYAYANQARIAQWNLACLAQSLLPVLSGDEDATLKAARHAVDAFSDLFRNAWLTEMRTKLGLAGAEEGDAVLIENLLKVMEEAEADFTLTFRGISNGSAREQFRDPKAFDRWLSDWRGRGGIETSGLNQINPLFIPRNHLVDAAITAGLDGDFKPFEDLLRVLSDPYTARSEHATYAKPPQPDERVYQTFCGT
ncbi:protein adenylyltransferase SelO [Nisaea sp.]|uniref:protein adenylyltransferase SelO n=2 Tax=Alphaproteobacteria TaxID=28211 RepID=UPI003263001C